MREQAIQFENRKWATTYVVISSEDTNFETARIEGYISLTHKVLTLGNQVSNRLRKKVHNGISMKNDAFHAVLIGQLGKAISDEYVSPITGKELLDIAVNIVQQSDKIIASPVISVECAVDRPKVQKMYEDYGFVEYQRDNRYIQYISKLKGE